jgi:hypothetical protein
MITQTFGQIAAKTLRDHRRSLVTQGQVYVVGGCIAVTAAAHGVTAAQPRLRRTV